MVGRLGGEIAQVHRRFDRAAFEREGLRGFAALELLDRGRHLGRVLLQHLPQDFAAAVDVLLATLPERKAPAGGMSSFYYLPHTEFVRQFGVPHIEASLRALHALTQVFTGEFAIRPFVEAFPLAKVRKRLVDGEGDNVAFYAHALAQILAEELPGVSPASPSA